MSGGRTRRPRTIVLAALAILVIHPGVALAHDLGGVLVRLAVGEARVDGEVRIDLDHRANAGTLADDRAAFAASSMLWIDGRPLLVEITGAREDSGTRTLLFRAPLPRGSRTLAWSTGAGAARSVVHVSTAREPDTLTQWLATGEKSDEIDLRPAAPRATAAETIVQYVREGFRHILPDGLDHILFVLGLFALTGKLRPTLVQASAFTVAHSITLGLAASGIVTPPERSVEVLIAASIVLLAIENIATRGMTRRRLGLAFAFGLLHGLGFAAALHELGLPQDRFLTALVSFNVGVEMGQAAVVGAAFLAVGVWSADRSWYRRGVAIPFSIGIACVAAVWTVQRAIA